MSKNENKIPSLLDIKEIKAIVIVDDARTITKEDMANIRKSLELEEKISRDDNAIEKRNEEDDFSENN